MQAPDIVVRAARLDDEPFCRRMDSDLDYLQPLGAGFGPLLQWCLVLVADYQNQSVGYLRVDRVFLKIPFIASIKVLPEFRRRGVAKALLDELLERERGQGAGYLLSSSEISAFQAIAWHQRNGFREIGTLQSMNPNGAAELFFRLDIPPSG